MSDNVNNLYPRDCSYEKQKVVYIRFQRAFRNAVGSQKQPLAEAIVYFVQHWNIPHERQRAWVLSISKGVRKF